MSSLRLSLHLSLPLYLMEITMRTNKIPVQLSTRSTYWMRLLYSSLRLLSSNCVLQWCHLGARERKKCKKVFFFSFQISVFEVWKLSNDYCTVSKNMLGIIIKLLIFFSQNQQCCGVKSYPCDEVKEPACGVARGIWGHYSTRILTEKLYFRQPLFISTFIVG